MIKLHLQETEYTCACAVSKMILESKGIVLSEMEIESLMKTDPVKGSSALDIIEFLKRYDIKSELVSGASLDDLKTDSVKLLLYKIFKRIPHVAIIQQITDRGMWLLDPAVGITFLKYKDLVWEADDIYKGFIEIK